MKAGSLTWRGVMGPGEISESGARGAIRGMIWWAMGSRAPSVTGEKMWWADSQIHHLWTSLLAASCIKSHSRSIYVSAQLYLMPVNNILYWCSSWVMSWVWIYSTLETKQKCYRVRDPVLWRNEGPEQHTAAVLKPHFYRIFFRYEKGSWGKIDKYVSLQ